MKKRNQKLNFLLFIFPFKKKEKSLFHCFFSSKRKRKKKSLSKKTFPLFFYFKRKRKSQTP